jgi:hypothetical protein
MVICKILGHKFKYEQRGILMCTRCVASVNANEIADRDTARYQNKKNTPDMTIEYRGFGGRGGGGTIKS